MKSTTATSLRKDLFGALKRAAHAVPTRIRYKKGEAVLLSYAQYRALRSRKKRSSRAGGLKPLLSGKILKPLDHGAEEELIRYIGL